LLGAEVEGKVLLVLVEQAELGALVGVDYGEDLCDGFADIMDLHELRSTGHLLSPQREQFGLQLSELLLEIGLALAPELTRLYFSGRHFWLSRSSA